MNRTHSEPRVMGTRNKPIDIAPSTSIRGSGVGVGVTAVEDCGPLRSPRVTPSCWRVSFSDRAAMVFGRALSRQWTITIARLH
jgi:hypothetical protein